MDGSSNSSFIPKRGPVNRPKKVVARQIYLFTVFSYLIFFATLSATAGIFFYEKYVVDKGLQERVQELESQINLFREDEMDKVKDFDARLKKVTDRVENSVSLGAAFRSLETATAQTVQYESLVFERINDERFELDVTMNADSFDAAILQRNAYDTDGLIATVDVTEIVYNEEGTGEDDFLVEDSERINVTAILTVPVADMPFNPAAGTFENSTVDTETSEVIIDEETDTLEVIDNETAI